jgi:hypothetical protein
MFAKYLVMYTAVSAAIGVAVTEAAKAAWEVSNLGQTFTFRDSVRSDGDVSNDAKDRSKSK